MFNYEQWDGFEGRLWKEEINTRDFIQKNYHPYDGDDSFLEGPTQDTTDLWDQVLELSRQEREAGGVLDMDTKRRLSVFRRTSLSNVLSSLTAVSVWRSRRARTMDTKSILKW